MIKVFSKKTGKSDGFYNKFCLVFLFIQIDFILNDEINTDLPLTSKNITWLLFLLKRHYNYNIPLANSSASLNFIYTY